MAGKEQENTTLYNPAPRQDPLSIKVPYTLADEILLNQLFSAMITMPVLIGSDYVPYTIPVFNVEDFSFSVGNEWQPLIDTSGANMLTGLINVASAITNDVQVSMQSRAMASASWKNSKYPVFSLSCMFVSTQRSFNPIDPIVALCSAVFPNVINTSGTNGIANWVQDRMQTGASVAIDFTNAVSTSVNRLFGTKIPVVSDNDKQQVQQLITAGVMTAPLNYKLTMNNGKLEPGVNTTCALRVGNWFRATKLIVEDISNITFSKEIIAPMAQYSALPKGVVHPELKENATLLDALNSSALDGANDKIQQATNVFASSYGFPLYSKCTITFRPITTLTYNEFCEYFIKRGNRPGAGT